MIDERFYTRTDIHNLNELLAINNARDLVINIESFNENILLKPMHSIAVLNEAQAGQITFFDNAKYKKDFLTSQAEFCIARDSFIADAPETMTVIASHDPYRLYALIASYLYKNHTLVSTPKDEYYEDAYGGKIHKNAVLEDNVQTAFGVVIESGVHIGKNTIIQPNCFIGAGCHIGRSCLIESNVSISHSLIGDHVFLSAGVKIGQDGFGFAMGKTHQKVPQLGRVIIQDNVSIGANSCLDRGTIKDTIIGEGTCIDNMVQVGHNVVMGMHCVVAGNTSIAGSVTFGDYVVCGGHSCIAGHLIIESQARISGAAAVIRNVSAKQTVA
ncbi:MAG: UDP-3-O-[3-hydroxymyristoyl] glucosamine N-acyltransferase, partial [Alphaproteobacteria bacterium]